MFVRGASPFGNPSSPALAPGTLPRRLVVDELDAPHRRLERQPLQQRASIFKRQRGYRSSVQPENVEDVIAAPAVPGYLTVENHLVDRKTGNGSGQRREILRKPVARVQLNVGAAFVREQSDAVELALEQPVVSDEA